MRWRGKTPFRHPSLHGFTLIELLVVIAIISLLVSILLPSLTAAKNLAKSVVCQTNLKNILYGSAMYSEDYEEYIVPVFTPGQGKAYSFNNWTGLLFPYLGGGDNISEFSSSDDLPAAVCPEFPLRFGYGHNYYLGRHQAMGPSLCFNFNHITDVKNPGSTVFFVDNINLSVPVDGVIQDPALFMSWMPYVRSPKQGYLNDVPPYFVHPGETANVGWVDAHVDARVVDGFYSPGYSDMELHEQYWDLE
jgi:prepilin-type N-terminal cleavage/methylation domain-containing protein/prepilin-type processing-associated H-X9-DG protein